MELREKGREEEEKEKVTGERRLGATQVLDFNPVKEGRAGLLQTFLGTGRG